MATTPKAMYPVSLCIAHQNAFHERESSRSDKVKLLPILPLSSLWLTFELSCLLFPTASRLLANSYINGSHNILLRYAAVQTEFRNRKLSIAIFQCGSPGVHWQETQSIATISCSKDQKGSAPDRDRKPSNSTDKASKKVNWG